MREMFLVFVCGLLLGFCIGWYASSYQLSLQYERDLERMKSWNDRLMQIIVTQPEFTHQVRKNRK